MTEPQTSARAGRKRWLAIAAFVIVTVFIGVGLFLSRQSEPSQVQGMVDADEIIVSAKVAGRVERLYVREGDRVQQGQPMFTLTGPEIAAKRAQAEAVIAAARAQSTVPSS